MKKKEKQFKQTTSVSKRDSLRKHKCIWEMIVINITRVRIKD
jgi:hypothetical protein